MAGTLPPPLRPVSINGDRLRQTPATAGGAGAGAPITAADTTVIKIVLASWQTLRDPVETFHQRQGRRGDASHHSKHPKLLVSLRHRKQSKERQTTGRESASPPPALSPPALQAQGQLPLAARQHVDSSAPSTGDAQPQTGSTAPNRPRTFFENPLATLRARKVVKVPRDRQFLHRHLRKVDRHDLQAVPPSPGTTTRAAGVPSNEGARLRRQRVCDAATTWREAAERGGIPAPQETAAVRDDNKVLVRQGWHPARYGTHTALTPASQIRTTSSTADGPGRVGPHRAPQEARAHPSPPHSDRDPFYVTYSSILVLPLASMPKWVRYRLSEFLWSLDRSTYCEATSPRHPGQNNKGKQRCATTQR